MKHFATIFGLFAATVPLSACAGYGYGHGGLVWISHPYYGWYDNYYGPFYDGYWGSDGFFYFRLGNHERSYRRDQYRHFRRDDRPPNDSFRRFEGTMQQPPKGTKMPRFPKSDRRPSGLGD